MNRPIYLLLIGMIVCLLPHLLVAQNAGQAMRQRLEDKRCKGEKLDLTGTYTGVLFVDKNQKEGTPATLTVSSDTFELTSDTLHGSGLISGVKSCGDIGIALKFTR